MRQVATIRLYGIMNKRFANITGIVRLCNSATTYHWQQLLQSHSEEIPLQLSAVDELLNQ